MRTSLIVPSCLLALGCGLPDPAGESVERERSGIVGGVTDTGDPAVVALTIQGQEYCTGTLIGPKTILTAAHCVNVYGTQATYYASFGTYVSQPTQRVRIAAQFAHPSYNSTTYDFGVLQLATAVTNVAPIALNHIPMTNAHVGLPIRHSGFGITSGGGGGGGIKREVTYGVRRVMTALIESGASGKQTCSGDSGGPAFMVMPGNTAETLVGVVSFGDEACTVFGSDGRVDVALSWITQTMAPWEAPACGNDGKCKPGCTPIDQDCACVGDTVCHPDCLDLLKDPDCPRDCVSNGICAIDSCPRPDPDCVSVGGPCVNAIQCKGRVCTSDPQHPNQKYCSLACTAANSPCPGGMECAPVQVCTLAQKPVLQPGELCTAADFCNQGTICTGPGVGGITRCVEGCNVQSDCPAQTTCEGGADGQRFCRPPEAVMRFNDIILERAFAEGAAAPSGCASAGLGELSLLTALLGAGSLIRRRRS